MPILLINNFFLFHFAELWNRWAQRVSCLSRNIFRIFCMGTADYARHHRKYIIRTPRSVNIFMILIDGVVVGGYFLFVLLCIVLFTEMSSVDILRHMQPPNTFTNWMIQFIHLFYTRYGCVCAVFLAYFYPK